MRTDFIGQWLHGLSAVFDGRGVCGLRQLQRQGGHGEALEGARALLSRFPENRDLLLIEAMSLRHLTHRRGAGRSGSAWSAPAAFSRLHQERGLCHIARKDAPQAIEALLRAVNINPALPMSWRMLEGLYRLTGDSGECGDRCRPCDHPEEACRRKW